MKTILKKIFEALYIKEIVKNQFDFGNQMGYSSGHITTAFKNLDISPKMQKKLTDTFGISKEYMTTGTGSMFITKSPEQSNPLPVKNTPVEHREKYPNSESDGVVSSPFNQNDQAMMNKALDILDRRLAKKDEQIDRLLSLLENERGMEDRTKSK